VTILSVEFMRQKAFYPLVFLAIHAAFGGQSLVVGGTGTPPSVTLPNTAPWTTIGVNTQPMRWEMRFHGMVSNLPQFGISYGASSMYQDTNNNEYSGTAAFMADSDLRAVIYGCCAGISDLLVRIQRDVVNSRYTFEVWNTQTGAYLSAVSSTITSWSGSSWAGYTLNAVTGEDTAWFRWYSSAVTMGTPINQAATGDLADWEFEGNLNDSSGHGLTMVAGSASVGYVATPTYMPSCSAGTSQTIRVGTSGTLHGTGSANDGGSTLTYAWTQTSGPTLAITGATTATPNVGPATAFADYVFSLACTDGSSQTTTSTVEDGSVVADASGIVTTGNSAFDTLVGGLVMDGMNPWPYADTSYAADASIQYQDLTTLPNSTTPYYFPYWDVADAGTITVTAGSTAVVGVGTTFTTTFCQGPGSPTVVQSGAGIIVWYPFGSLTGHRLMPIASCTDNTHMTMQQPWGTDVSDCHSGGCGYADNSAAGTWEYSISPANYYDNVVAFYGEYYRTGLTKWQTAARLLADRFWEGPDMDRGNTYTQGAYAENPPRKHSLMGLVLRALDSPPQDMWTGLEKLFANSPEWIDTGYPSTWLPGVYDVRESAYSLAELAECALFDPNAYKTTCQSVVNRVITGYYTTARFSDGSWRDFYGTTDLTSYVTLTHGSTAVTGVGTAGDWASSNFNPTTPPYNQIWFFDATHNATPCTNPYSCMPDNNGDNTAYTPTWVSTTSLTLDRPYAGTTGTYGWVLGLGGVQIGYGALPYMEGLLTKAFGLAAKSIETAYPTAAALASSYGVDAANWIRTTGYSPDLKAIWYAAGYVNCQPPINPAGNTPCTMDYAASTEREVNLETIGGITMAYEYNHNSALLAFAQTLYNAAWAKPGTCVSSLCVSDGTYVNAWDSFYISGAPPVSGAAPKYFGQAFGYSMWDFPAVVSSSSRPVPVFGRGAVIGLGVVR